MTGSWLKRLGTFLRGLTGRLGRQRAGAPMNERTDSASPALAGPHHVASSPGAAQPIDLTGLTKERAEAVRDWLEVHHQAPPELSCLPEGFALRRK